MEVRKVAWWVCVGGSVGLRHLGNKVLEKRPQKKFKGADTQLKSRVQPYFIWKKKKFKVHERKTSKVKKTREFKINQSPHVMKLMGKVDRHVTNPVSRQGTRGWREGTGETVGGGDRLFC